MTIYEIDERIASLVDPETGELSDIDAFMALSMERELKIENMALWYKNLISDADAIRTEERALSERRKAAERRAERLREYLNTVLAGEKFTTPRVAVSFRRSQAVEVDDAFVAWAETHATELLRIKPPEPNLTEITRRIKAGDTFEYAHLAETQNIQIK